MDQRVKYPALTLSCLLRNIYHRLYKLIIHIILEFDLQTVHCYRKMMLLKGTVAREKCFHKGYMDLLTVD